MAGMALALGFDVEKFISETDPFQHLVYQAVINEASDIARIWREDLANRIAKKLAG